jgi:hypothetical protein
LPLLRLDDSDRHEDDELDADRRRPPSPCPGAPSDDRKLLPDEPDDDDAPDDRLPEPPPVLPSRSLLRNTGSGKKHLLLAAASSSSGPRPYDATGATRGAMSRNAVGRCGGRRRDGDTDAERAA